MNERMIDLLCLLAVGDSSPNVNRHLADVEHMVREHVRHHVADPSLSGHTIARDLGWSLRQIQLALQHAGTTPSELIKDERLKLARYRLESPTYQHMSITEIGYGLGFCSPSAFSTAFKQHFGVRPSSIRQ
ncbi:helix-turn-helix transcriptional regulator [Tamaricihabitans halophyticus]|uniref:helix-turn-helix transcriptional regulator n=1 Tax=Tamaricihabitans halophyticus TaxID=1262583 RepID=UPI001FB3DD63|nr:helix-turn-helix transcriptional regulator [Tamaricihabitans halophyticus]